MQAVQRKDFIMSLLRIIIYMFASAIFMLLVALNFMKFQGVIKRWY